MKPCSLYFLIVILLVLSSKTGAQRWKKVFSDTTVFSVDTATIGKKKYIIFLKDELFFLLNYCGDTLLKKKDDYNGSEFQDFNKDGYKDIILHYSSNGSMVLGLFLYVPLTGKFREIKDFNEFPAPEPIKKGKYY